MNPTKEACSDLRVWQRARARARAVETATLDVPGLISLIRAIAEMHDSYDSYAEGLAIEALQHGRPVFWTRTTYHNQRALVLHTRTLAIGLAAALAEDMRRAEHIDTLIPLGPAAEAALEEARWQIAGAPMAAE